ncbi:MAG: DUF817 domain-containing protein [Pseudomonadota bacterium]
MERTLERALPHSLVRVLTEFLVFGVKQAWACLFGGLLLFAILMTSSFWPTNAPMARYDALFVFAVSIQALFLVTRLERPQEAVVILVFHLVGTAMEVFKTDVGSWVYPEENVLRIGGVPLFSGFMYAAVGSYLARATRVFDFTWDHYPNRLATLGLSVLIYVNFFSHHWIYDFRWWLFAIAGLLFWRTHVHFRVWRWRHQMPLLIGFLLISVFLWIAENIGTYTRTWLYPEQTSSWQLVSLSKMGSWYLLMIISWVLVTLVQRPVTRNAIMQAATARPDFPQDHTNARTGQSEASPAPDQHPRRPR